MLFLDIETIPDQSIDARERIAKIIKPPKNITKPETLKKWETEKKPLAIGEKWLKTALDGSYGQIVSIAAAASGNYINNSFQWFVETTENMTENELLAAFYSWVHDTYNQWGVMVTAHNARFDLQFVKLRSIINKVPPTFKLKPFGRHGIDYFCTMEAWAGFNGFIGLDELCRILDIPGKEMTGADVWPMYQAEMWKEIKEYNRADVEKLIEVYNRINLGE